MKLPSDRQGKYFMYLCAMFLRRYAEHSYEEAASWGRKLAEVYCIIVLAYFQRDVRYMGLAEMQWELPDWVWQHSAWEHADALGEPYRGKAIELVTCTATGPQVTA